MNYMSSSSIPLMPSISGGCQDCDCTNTKTELIAAGKTLGDKCPDCICDPRGRGIGRHRDHPTASGILPPIKYSVEAFGSPNLLTGSFLLAELKTPLPMAHCTTRCPVATDCNYQTFDAILSPAIATWMSGNTGDGKSGIIARDDAWCTIYWSLAGLGKYARNKEEDPDVMMSRADRTDKADGLPVVMVEEPDVSARAGTTDLFRKFRWLPHYAGIPFIFGVSITVDELIISTMTDGGMTTVFTANLNSDVQRWNCVIAAVNIARTLKLFRSGLLIPSPIGFGEWLDQSGKKVRLELEYFEVQYHSRSDFNRMKAFYTATTKVPYLEHLYTGRSGVNESENRFKLVPVGAPRKPRNNVELNNAIHQIGKCLAHLHSVGYVHCNVRWSNIVEVGNSWYLVDSESVCLLKDTHLLSQRSSETIKKQYVMDSTAPWSARFDYYQLGLLIADTDIQVDKSFAIVQLQDELLSNRISDGAYFDDKYCAAIFDV